MGEEMSRSTENEIAFGVLGYLATIPTGEATIFAIKKNFAQFCTLSPEDHRDSTTRPGEEVWEQQVRNIVSHRNVLGNYIKEGNLTRSSRRLAITPVGRAHLAAGKP